MPVHKAKRGIISSSHLRGSLTSFCAHLNSKPIGSGLHFQMHYLTFLQAGIFLILFLGRLISVVTSTRIELPAWAVKLLGFGSIVQSCRGSVTSTLTLIFSHKPYYFQYSSVYIYHVLVKCLFIQSHQPSVLDITLKMYCI